MCCVLFSNREGGRGHQALGMLVTKPYINKWKNALENFRSHERKAYHIDCSARAANFKKRMENVNEDIMLKVNVGHAATVQKNRDCLCPIIQTLLLCGRQNIALRGSNDFGPLQLQSPSENDGNFRELLRYRIKAGDVNLRDHVESSAQNAQYLSPRIQNELIDVCGQLISETVSKRINRAKAFSVLADETTDICGIEQLCVCVRYVDAERPEANSVSQLREDFLGFIPVHDLSGEALAETILKGLRHWGIDVQYVRGQGYDGASNMSGKMKGVHAVISRDYPLAPYVHCASHALNLVLSGSCTVPSIRNCLGVVSEVAKFFRASPKRSGILQKNIEKCFPDKQKCRMKLLCETRWVERHEALMTFCELIIPIADTLEQLSDSTGEAGAKAGQLYASMCSSMFVISLTIAEKVFSTTYSLSTYLQSQTIDLASALDQVALVTTHFQRMRDNSETAFSKLYGEACSTAQTLELDLNKLPRCCGRQTYRSNIQGTPEDYYRATVFIPMIDFMLSELNSRFTNHRAVLLMFRAFLPRYCCDAVFEDVLNTLVKYQPDLLLAARQLSGEFALWQDSWKDADESKRPAIAIDALNACDKEFYPNVHRMLKLFATLPVSTATPERSFSALRRLKTYLRNSTSENRLNGLALLNIHREVCINVEEIIDRFAACKSRRIPFALK